MRCPNCDGVVEDHVCTNCGTAVWPGQDDQPGEPQAGREGARDAPVGSTPPPPPPPPPPMSLSAGTPTAAPRSGGGGGGGKTLLWVLGGLGVVAVIGIAAVAFLFVNRVDDLERIGSGSPERLAVLQENCDQGDMQACDDLFLEAPFDSAEEAFGDSCGNRNEPAGWCVDIHGETVPPN